MTSETLSDEMIDTFKLILSIGSKLTRDELNAIMGIIKSYRDEAEYYRKKSEGQL